MDQYIGRLLDDRYEILEIIGTGGMAVVYKARDHRLNRLVAVKILKDEFARDEEFRRRFRAEGEAVAMLSHPNIVQVYDVSASDSANYIVMELIDGISLKQYMEKKGVLNWKETLHFAMQIAKRSASRRFVLCEGYMDVISLHKAGIENAIASLGTALTAEQARIIARYAKEVVICYDSDEAGQKAAQRAIPILRGAGLLVRVMAVPGNKDPDEFINACGDEGAARFRRLIEQSGNDVEYRLAKLKSGYDLNNESGRIQYLMAAVELLAGLENAIERDVYVSRLSQELNVDKNAILQQMSVSVRKKARAAQRQQQRDMTEQLSARRDTVNPEKRRYVRVANAEERLIACLFHNNDLAQSLNRRVPPEKFVTAFNRRLYQSLLGKIINEETVTSPQITDFSAECTPDEMGRLAKIVQENAGITAKDAEEYVQIILSEGALTDTDKVRGANPADLQAQLDALRKQKK